MGTESPTVNGTDRYDMLVVEKYEDVKGAAKSSWTRIGVAFPHKDGNGLNVDLKAMPALQEQLSAAVFTESENSLR